MSRKYGFQGMDRERVKQIASLGGRRAHELGVAHQWTAQEATEAGRLGGLRRKNDKKG